MTQSVLSESETTELIGGTVQYVLQQRDYYWPSRRPLTSRERQVIGGFFEDSLTDLVAIVELDGELIARPPLAMREVLSAHYEVPSLHRMVSVTLRDLLVFQRKLTDRRLFHAMVHACQFAELGIEAYFDLYLRAFLRCGDYLKIPMEAHVHELEARFAESPQHFFNATQQVRMRIQQRQY
jgi:hypothetical protein